MKAHKLVDLIVEMRELIEFHELHETDSKAAELIVKADTLENQFYGRVGFLDDKGKEIPGGIRGRRDMPTKEERDAPIVFDDLQEEQDNDEWIEGVRVANINPLAP